MSLTNLTTKQTYECDGIKTVFEYPFKIWDKTWLQVVKTDTTDGSETVLTVDVDYTVSGAGDEAGGDVTLLIAAPSSDFKITVERVPPLKQQASYTETDKFPAKTHEYALDKIVMMCQYLKSLVDRALKVDVTEASDIVFPALSIGYLYCDGSGDLTWTPLTSVGDYPGTFSAGADAAKPATPSVKDLYYATDTDTLYACATAGNWTSVSIHISTLTEKTTPVDADLILIEDSAASYARKKVQKINFLDGKARASSGDATPDYLDGKVDGTTIEVSGDELRVLPSIITRVNVKRVSVLPQGSPYRFNGFIMNDGSVRMVGSYTVGKLGDGLGSPACRYFPVRAALPAAGLPAASIFLTYENTYVITEAGDVYACGSNAAGQLGDGTTATKYILTKVGTIANVAKFAAGLSNGYVETCCFIVQDDGKLYTWGANYGGQLGDGTTTNQTSPTQVSGTWSDVAVNGARYAHALALKSNGDVYACGVDDHGELGQGATGTDLTTFTKIATLSNIAKIYAVGADSAAVNYGASFFVTTTGTVYACGYNSDGQLGIGNTTDQNSPQLISGLTDVDRLVISKGLTPTVCAILTDGTIRLWGNNSNGQVGNGTTTDQTSPYDPGLSDVSDVVFAGSNGTISVFVLHTDGTVSVCGYNADGQLGLGHQTQLTSFVTLTNLPDQVAAISAAGQTTEGFPMFLMNDGQLLVCGENPVGELGIGSAALISVPTPVIL